MKNNEGKRNKAGKLHGLYRYYYDNGNVLAEVMYQFGIQNGFFRRYWEDGKVGITGQSYQHKPYDIENRYDDDGKIIKQTLHIV